MLNFKNTLITKKLLDRLPVLNILYYSSVTGDTLFLARTFSVKYSCNVEMMIIRGVKQALQNLFLIQ